MVGISRQAGGRRQWAVWSSGSRTVPEEAKGSLTRFLTRFPSRVGRFPLFSPNPHKQ